MVNAKIQTIFYATPEHHHIKLPAIQKQVTFLEGLPEIEFFSNLNKDSAKILIIDDFSNEKQDIAKITQMFTRVSHHCNISIFFMTQNMYEKGIRTISLNSHYLVLFKNLRDSLQIKMISRQIFPENSSFLLDAYNDATAKPYGYLIIDLTQKCHDLLRVRSNILPSDNPRNVVYIPKNAHCSASIELDGA